MLTAGREFKERNCMKRRVVISGEVKGLLGGAEKVIIKKYYDELRLYGAVSSFRPSFSFCFVFVLKQVAAR